MLAFWVATAALFGAIVGSFFNVVVVRLPAHESLVKPRSRCPQCKHPIAAIDNIPIASWFLLKGRCRHCQTKISIRYPIVEACTAAIASLIVLDQHGSDRMWFSLALFALLIPIVVIDIDHRIVPNSLTAIGTVVAVCLLVVLTPDDFLNHLMWAAIVGGALAITVFLYPAGMGMGDAKLVFVLGLFLGQAVMPCLVFAFFGGTVFGVLVIMRKGMAEGRKTAVPFAPFLSAGGIFGVFFGPTLVDWYFRTFTL